MNIDRLKQSVYSNSLSRDAINKEILQTNTIDNVIEYDKVDEKIYFNLKLFNNTVNDIPVKFDITRTDTVINNVNEYEVGVENFSLPSGSISIFRSSPASDTDYTVTIYDLQEDENKEEVVEFFALMGENVDDYDRIVLAVNLAINNACLTLADVTGDSITPPFINNVEGIYKFYFPLEFTNNYQLLVPETDSRYKLKFSDELLSIFSCFKTVYRPDIGLYEYFIESNLRQGDNTITWEGIQYNIVNGQFDPRQSMIKWNRLLFLTDIPVRNEKLGTEKQEMETQLIDYILNNRVLDKRTINFYPQYIKYNNLINESSLRRMNVRVVLEYFDGTQYPLYIPNNTTFFMKLVFRKKNNGLSV